MVTKWGNMVIIAGFCTIIILTTFIAGCTTSNSGTNNSVFTPAEPTSNQVQVVQPVNPGNPTKIQDQQQKGPVTLTINSAKKMMSLGKARPSKGHIFLVLDITVKNRNVDQGYIFGNKSITLKDSEGNVYNFELSSRPEIQIELANPILPQTKLGLNDTITGQVLFGILDSTNFDLNLMGKGGKGVLTSQPVNFDSLLTTEKPVSLTINSAKKIANFGNGTPMPMGKHIYLILNVTLKNSDMKEGLDFTDDSITMLDLNGDDFVDQSLNSGQNLRKNLESPIILPITIEPNEIINGQLIFGIADSTDYRLNLLDNDKVVILSKNIHVE